MNKLKTLALLSIVTFSTLSFANPHKRAVIISAQMAAVAAQQARRGPFTTKQRLICYPYVWRPANLRPEIPDAHNLARIMRTGHHARFKAVMVHNQFFNDPRELAAAAAAAAQLGGGCVRVDALEYDDDHDDGNLD